MRKGPAARASDAGNGRLVLYFDGACRGNPGPASWGVYSPAGPDGRPLERAGAIGTTTNNVAEWQGLLAALDTALETGAADVEIRADSQLVVRQFTGEYRMKAAHLAGFLTEARAKAARIPQIRVVHVPREENREADRLANAALDEEKEARTLARRAGDDKTARPLPRPR